MSLTDFSDYEKGITDAEAPKILPKGTIAKLRIILVRTGTSNKHSDAKWFQPVFDLPDDPMVVQFNDFMWFPGQQDKVEPDQFARNQYRLQTFVQAFGIDLSKPFDIENDWNGLTGYAILGFKQDSEYGDKNTISKYVSGPQSVPGKPASKSISDDDIPF
jgi:hypothetical protein